MKLRDYQQRAINQLYDWFRAGNEGNPCLVLPTGSGKSHIVAALCKDALQSWPETRVLMLTHVKELIEQNAEKMRQHWPGAPLGIYSASIGRKDLGEPITFAGIQSVRSKARELGHIDLVIIDECHLVNHKDEGGYRTLLDELQAINPALRVVGLTATPYRLGHGLITDAPAIFADLIEPVSIEELVFKGHLSKLRSKVTEARLDVSGVKKRGGEYIEADLQRAVDTADQNDAVVREVIARAGNRKAWLFFCTGVAHAQHVAEVMQEYGIAAACVTGDTPKTERAAILSAFKAGKLKALTNANVLTTGFDYPDIDLIAMLRPTMSPSLYVQMAGRGMRPKSHTDHCLVLDFAGVVETHGPITAVQPPKKAGSGEGEAPVKVCDTCNELCPISARQCPACGAEFPAPGPKRFELRTDDIMGIEPSEMAVTDWRWRKHVSKASGKEMLAVTYYGALSEKPITEYLPINHEGYAGQKALGHLLAMKAKSGAPDTTDHSLDGISASMNAGMPPANITYKQDGKFYRVLTRKWNESQQNMKSNESLSDGSGNLSRASGYLPFPMAAQGRQV
jgi:DNA repair protein RadD